MKYVKYTMIAIFAFIISAACDEYTDIETAEALTSLRSNDEEVSEEAESMDAELLNPFIDIEGIDEDQAKSDQLRQSFVDFRMGLQIGDTGGVAGNWDFTPTMDYSGVLSTDWVCDGPDCYDPNRARVQIDVSDPNDIKYNKDFRLCLKASDGRYAHTQEGAWACTPYASQGGGTSGMASDIGTNKPDSYKLSIQTRPWPNPGSSIVNFRVRLACWNDDTHPYRVGWSSWSPWLRNGGGNTGWIGAGDPTATGFEIQLQVSESSR